MASFDLRIQDIPELTVRHNTCFNNKEIVYLGQLVQKNHDQLMSIRNFGRKSLRGLEQFLSQLGMHLGMDVGDWKPPDEHEPQAQ